MKNICVFCGSQAGHHAVYAEEAATLGKRLAEEKVRLIYGGGSIGLMGVVADAVLAHGGEAIGVIPRFLYEKEVGHGALSNLIIVNTMHERKQKMAELADGFIALPGGIGTLEELFEIFTWVQLQIIQKPLGLLNINGYFSHLKSFLQHIVDEGFMTAHTYNILLQADDIDALLPAMLNAARHTREGDMDKT